MNDDRPNVSLEISQSAFGWTVYLSTPVQNAVGDCYLFHQLQRLRLNTGPSDSLFNFYLYKSLYSNVNTAVDLTVLGLLNDGSGRASPSLSLRVKEFPKYRKEVPIFATRRQDVPDIQSLRLS